MLQSKNKCHFIIPILKVSVTKFQGFFYLSNFFVWPLSAILKGQYWPWALLGRPEQGWYGWISTLWCHSKLPYDGHCIPGLLKQIMATLVGRYHQQEVDWYPFSTCFWTNQDHTEVKPWERWKNCPLLFLLPGTAAGERNLLKFCPTNFHSIFIFLKGVNEAN